MRKFFVLLFTLVVTLCVAANATDLSGNLTADNGFIVFVSTNNAILGTQITDGGNWGTTYTFNGFTLTPGVTNYLQIEAMNWGGAGAFIGDFSLSDTGFHFANGSQSLVTNPADWLGIYNNGNTSVTAQTWVVPAYDVYSDGLNGVGPWGFHGGISSTAEWIWPNDASSAGCGSCTVDFSVPIYPATTGTPEPGTILTFASGALGLVGVMRRKLMR